MLLSKLVEAMPNARVEDRLISRLPGFAAIHVSSDGSVFVALTGGQIQDRHQFIEDALARGAVAIISQRESLAK